MIRGFDGIALANRMLVVTWGLARPGTLVG
jgi:hypothetical protein